MPTEQSDEIISLLKEIRDNQLLHLKNQARSMELQEQNVARFKSQADKAASFMDGYNKLTGRLLKPAIIILVGCLIFVTWKFVR